MEVLTVLSEEPLLIECIRYTLTSPNDIMTDYDFRENLLSHRCKEGCIIDGYVGDEDEILIPATLYGEPVVRVNLDDLSLNETHTALIISEGVKEISVSFGDCRYLNHLVIPESARFITPPESIQYTEWYRKQPDAPIYLGGYYCGTPGGGSGKDTLTIPDGVIGIAPSVDFNAYWHRIEIPDSVLFIGEYAFARCPCLEEVKLPVSMHHLGEGAFQSCPRLAYIRIPDGLQAPVESFQLCDSLWEVSMPEACWEEHDCYFSNCPRILLRGDGNDRVILKDLRLASVRGSASAFPDDRAFSAGGRIYRDISYLTRQLLIEVKEYRDSYGNRVRHIREKDPQLRAANGGVYWREFWFTAGPKGVTQITHEDFTDVRLVWDGIPLSEIPKHLKPYVSDLFSPECD